MKNKIIVITVLIIAVVGILGILRGKQSGINAKPYVSHPVTSGVSKPSVQVIINDGRNILSYSGINAQNAYEALTAAAANNNIQVVTKKYDFGIFVTQIAGKVSDTNNAWIYFVNGKSGTVAADKTPLKSGDSVEWRYTKPTM
jgi:hypothetical protein